MSATLAQIITATESPGLLRRAVAAADALGIVNAPAAVGGAFGRIVAAEVTHGSDTTSIAYAFEYHRAKAAADIDTMNAGRDGLPPLTVELAQLGDDPRGVSDAIITAAVAKVLA